MKVEVWSDVVCPWCYIGKRHLEQALEQFEHSDEVELVWRSFELDPRAPAKREGPLFEHLARKYGTSLAQAEAMGERVADAARGVGLDFQFGKAQSGNTFDAHRLLHEAHAQGLGDAFKERVMKAYFCEGLLPSDHEALEALAVEVGLDAEKAREVLASDKWAQDVRQDEVKAHDIGVRGVPFFLFGEKFGASGAQPVEHLLVGLKRAWDENTPVDAPEEDATVCTPEGCS